MCKLTTSRILATALFISNLLHGVRAWTSITTKTAITTTITTTTRTPRSLLSRHGARPSRPASSLPASLSSNLVDSSTATTSIADISNNNIVDWDWQSLASSAFIDTDTRPILLFDGVCNFCNAGVNLAIDLDMTDQGAIRFCSLQSKTGQSLLLQHGKHANDLSSVVLVESLDTAYFESEAVLRTAELLNGLPALVRLTAALGRKVLPGFARNAAYHVVGRNRYIFGERETASCRFDFDGSLASRFLEDPVVEETLDTATATALVINEEL